MLLALSRRYVCRRRTGNHALYPLFSQFSSSSGSTSTRSSMTKGEAAYNWPLFPRMEPPLDAFFKILGSMEKDDDYPVSPTETVCAAFKRVGFPGFQPSVPFVLQVLTSYNGNINNNDDPMSLSSYLAFFEWADEQVGFLHTPQTFDALNQIMSGLNPILFKDLANVLDFKPHYRVYRGCVYTTLFVGYLIARMPTHASLTHRRLSDARLITHASYNATLNVLLQHKLFAEADAVFRDDNINISLPSTQIIMVHVNDGEYLRGLVCSDNRVQARFCGGPALIALVKDDCLNQRFKDAAHLIDEFKELSSFESYKPYEIWITSAYKYAESDSAASKVAALADQMQMAHEACNPDVVRYTGSLIQLVTENRLDEASQLLREMKELQFMPRKPAVAQLMCYLIKADALDIALELYKLRPESQSSMRSYFLLNLLCGGGYQGTCCVLAGAPHCCEEDNFDRLVQALYLRFRYSKYELPGSFRSFLYNKLISALCRAGTVEDAYLLYGELDDEYYHGQIMRTSDEAYYHMVHGFRKINKQDVADKLLLEMHKPKRTE